VRKKNLIIKVKQEITLWMSEKNRLKFMIYKETWHGDIKSVKVTMMSDINTQLII
jgi:hypothetical protein